MTENDFLKQVFKVVSEYAVRRFDMVNFNPTLDNVKSLECTGVGFYIDVINLTVPKSIVPDFKGSGIIITTDIEDVQMGVVFFFVDNVISTIELFIHGPGEFKQFPKFVEVEYFVHKDV